MRNLKELNEQLLNVKSQLDKKMAELYENGVAYPEMNEEVVRLNNEIASINNEILSSKRELTANVAILRKEATEKELLDVENRLNNRISELHNEGNPYPQLDEAVMNLEAQIPNLKTELSDIENYITNNNITSTLSDLENQYKNIYSLLEARKKELYESGNQYPEMDTEIIRLNSELTGLTQGIAKMHNKLKVDAYMIQKEKLETKLDTLNNELNDRMDTLNREENLYPQMDETVIKLNNEISALKNNIVELDKRYENNTLTDEVFDVVELPKVEVANKTDDTINEYSEQTVQNETVNKEQESEIHQEQEQSEQVDLSNTANEISKPIIQENSIQNTSETKENEQTDDALKTQLLAEKKKYNVQLKILEKYLNGEINLKNEKTESFDEQIKRLKSKISSIQLQENKPIEMSVILNNSRNDLENLIIDNETSISANESQAIEFYRKAASLPTVNNIITALKLSATLPDESIFKSNLIDTITKIDAAYIKDEDDVKLTRDTMNSLNIKPFDINENNPENQITKLIQEIESVNKEREKRKIIATKKINDINSKIADIDKMLLESKQDINQTTDHKIDENSNSESDIPPVIPTTGHEIGENPNSESDIPPVMDDNDNNEEELPPTFAPDENSQSRFGGIAAKIRELASKKSDNDLKEQNQEYQEYANKLEQIASEGRIFTDEARVNEENNWMESKTAQSLGALDNSDNYLNNEDSLAKPHIIKSVKKASQKLIEKIRNTKFSEKVSIALNYLKKAKLAVVTGAIIIAAGVASLGASKNINGTLENNTAVIQEYESDNNTDLNSPTDNIIDQENETEFTNDDANQMQESEATDIDFNTQLQNQINEILNGQTGVYTSSDRAISGTDMKMPTSNQIENSWIMAEPSVFYDAEGNKISEADAIEKVENGEQIAARMDNDRGTAGYINVGASNENTSGFTR